MKVKVIFPASMKNVGLLYHFTFLTIELAKVFRNTNYSFLMVSEKSEQNKGLWDKIFSELNLNEFEMCENYHEFTGVYKRFLEDIRYDKVIVLTQGIMQVLECIKLKRKYGGKLVVYTRLNSFKHGSNLRAPLTYFLSFIFCKFCDVVNFQCDYTISIFYNSRRIINSGKAITIPLGLSHENLIRIDDSKIAEYFENENTFKIIYLAQLHEHKNHSRIIDKLKNMLQRNENIKVFFLGSGVEMNRLKRKVFSLGLQDNIFFLGRIDRSYIPWIISKSNLAFALSNVETFGHVILEPLFYGVPVIAKNVGIANDVIKDFDNGFVVREKSLMNLDLIVEHFMNRRIRNVNADYSSYTWSEIAKSYLNLCDYLALKTDSNA